MAQNPGPKLPFPNVLHFPASGSPPPREVGVTDRTYRKASDYDIVRAHQPLLAEFWSAFLTSKMVITIPTSDNPELT